ncbi:MULTISPECIES: hypothetical protein [Calothrix]|uniref:Uncharacterized protein n=2 Tax=Calothrix TaxID=1186 RepID=A0ABR8AEB9_9CYAN|nr:MULTISPECIES: hypothetical protein [Calothrix]BAY64238.1 hypothetical protein NIES22_43330 [Calothrix brevissima NIES-22]MBD2198269.1 hypothetical protein [Calothrix parietina FACHB-288]MBD2202861.1 hypothetical protein [Calothrix sp. FACHB-168]MBD2215989.1 hypothetical protein [Calothrix sp. FACHB-1219]MBD2226592.1 hypothetical protein [Calothrix anomala FACHB-343]
MTTFTNFLRSLLLTAIFSFLVPMFLVGGFLLLLPVIGYVPGFDALTDAIASQILYFLGIFGTDSPLRGLIVISLTFSFVGALFDVYAYYRCQILRIDS